MAPKTITTTESTTKRKRIAGVVVSDKGTKTVIVEVNRYIKHPQAGKYVRRSKRIPAHDEAETASVGDTVWIEACRPRSKTKHFEVVAIETKK